MGRGEAFCAWLTRVFDKIWHFFYGDLFKPSKFVSPWVIGLGLVDSYNAGRLNNTA